MHANDLHRTSEDDERQYSASKKPFNLMLVDDMHKDFQCPIDPNRHTNSWKEGPYEVIIRSVTRQKCQDERGRAFIYILRAPLILGRILERNRVFQEINGIINYFSWI